MIAAVVVACPAVAAVSGGPPGTAATYLPGRSVPGVRCGTDLVEVHVVLRYGSSVGDAVSQMRGALVRQLAGRRLDVVFEDVTDPVEAEAHVAAGLPQAGSSPYPSAGTTSAQPSASESSSCRRR